METIYRAKDGTEFKREYECQAYEFDLAFNNINCKLLDTNMQPAKDPEGVWYARFNSYDDIKEFNDICNEQMVSGVECDIDETKPLAFFYDDTSGGYIQYAIAIEELENDLLLLKERYEQLLSI